jgi:SAM-dependent methyltransferase
MDHILTRYRADLGPTEFPITAMSEALGRALDGVLSNPPSRFRSAVDVGTGSGIHAAILGAHGLAKVLAIDLSNDAVEGARARLDRLGPALGPRRGPVAFENLGVDDLPDMGETFDLAVTNPPSFFRPSGLEASHMSPVEHGVYDGTRRERADPKTAFLYRFWKSVDAVLAPNGVAICTWPGLERRLVHDLASAGHPIIHPTALLERWFGWEISGAPPPTAWRPFYRYQATISTYGLGERFTDDLTYDLSHGRLYSDLVHGPTGKAPAPSFAFGILALQRDASAAGRFSMLPLNSPSGVTGPPE